MLGMLIFAIGAAILVLWLYVDERRARARRARAAPATAIATSGRMDWKDILLIVGALVAVTIVAIARIGAFRV